MSETEYYFALNRELARAGPPGTCVVIDVDRLDDNIHAITTSLPRDRALRIVDRSLPAPMLIRHVMEQARTRRLMSFHLPFLAQLLEESEPLDILIAQPQPVQAAQAFFAAQRRAAWPRLAREIAWLVDTPERLSQYLALAERLELRIRISLEVDLGGRRGGFVAPEDLAPLMDMMYAHGERLRFAGLVGCDAHAVEAPWPLRTDAVVDRAQRLYRDFVDYVSIRYQPLLLDPPIWSIGGSGTFRLHSPQSPPNDVAIGAAFLKPAELDGASLAEVEPAAWVAAPVLRRLRGVRVPYLGRLGGWLSGGRGRDACFADGGHTDVVPVHPAGTRAKILHRAGRQEPLFMVPTGAVLGVDDRLFLRPIRSDAVLRDYGDLVVVRENRVVDRWPLFKR